MDEKHIAPQTMAPSRSLRRARPAATVFFVITSFYFFYLWMPYVIPAPADFLIPETTNELDIASPKLVPLEAHIISKCPDTRVGYLEYIITK